MVSAQKIRDLYLAHGKKIYPGEAVSHLEHAWQCGQLAYFAEASPELQLACWLHDLGQLLSDAKTMLPLRRHNPQHEELGADLIEQCWGPAVAEPVRLHVLAKRYLVTRHPHYRAKLSAASLGSLVPQGGEMSPEECVDFERSPHHKCALLLRVWDEQAKQRDWFATSHQDALDQLHELMNELRG